MQILGWESRAASIPAIVILIPKLHFYEFVAHNKNIIFILYLLKLRIKY